MANKQIKDFTEQTTLDDNDIVLLQNSSSFLNKKVKISTLVTKVIAFILAVTSTSTASDEILVLESGAIRKMTKAALKDYMMQKTQSAVSPSTGATVDIPPATDFYYVNNSSTLAALTVRLPASYVANKVYTISFKSAVTALTLSGQGNAIQNGITTAAAGTVVSFIFNDNADAYVRA